jgi:hypothetical protein
MLPEKSTAPTSMPSHQDPFEVNTFTARTKLLSESNGGSMSSSVYIGNEDDSKYTKKASQSAERTLRFVPLQNLQSDSKNTSFILFLLSYISHSHQQNFPFAIHMLVRLFLALLAHGTTKKIAQFVFNHFILLLSFLPFSFLPSSRFNDESSRKCHLNKGGLDSSRPKKLPLSKLLPWTSNTLFIWLLKPAASLYSIP